METTFMRGFSNTYVPNKKVEEVMDLQFIEGGELERMWKLARRERLKVQEEKIWSEFVQDQDVLQNVVKEDKYQFIESVPEDCLKELLNTEVIRTKLEAEEQTHAGGDSLSLGSPSVTNDEERERGEMFNIFDEEKEDEFTADDDGLEEVDEPCTVRERTDTDTNARACGTSEIATEKNSDTNMATMIESSIYCAKVKNLRAKIKEELLAMIPSLENLNLANVDKCTLRKMRTRAAEYASRFQRIHFYQLTRHMHDLERHNAQALPFAKHTQFQSQMVRIVALHTNTLQAIQVFHKSFEQTACLSECADQLRSLCAALKQSVEVCKSVPVPHNFCAARELYNDDLVDVCAQVETCVTEYMDRVADIVNAAEDNRSKRRDREKSKLKRKSIGSWSRNATKNTLSNSGAGISDPRLSMYSLDVQSVTKPRPVRTRRLMNTKNSIMKKEITKKEKLLTPRSHRKTPRSRLPLMRAPNGARKRPEAAVARLANDDLHTMVEAVDLAASLVSNENSPRRVNPRSPRSSRSPPALQPASHNGTKRSPYMARANARDGPSASVRPRSPRLLYSSRSPPSCRDPLTNRSDASDRSKVPPLGLDSIRSPRGRNSLNERDCNRSDPLDAPSYDVTTILRQLCGGDATGSRNERVPGAKNAQLLTINNNISPRQPTTPQLLRILEETIQKKAPKPMQPRRVDTDRLRLAFNTPQRVADHLFQYRTKFVQHMLASSMYANSAVGKPWEIIGSVADQMIAEILVECAWEMELVPMVSQLYLTETKATKRH